MNTCALCCGPGSQCLSVHVPVFSFEFCREFLMNSYMGIVVVHFGYALLQPRSMSIYWLRSIGKDSTNSYGLILEPCLGTPLIWYRIIADL